MNLAVKLFGDVPAEEKPAGIPDTWPAEVIELGSSVDLPDGDWTFFTTESFAFYRAAHVDEYNTWLEASALLAAKQAKIAALQDEAQVFLESKYAFLNRVQLMNLYTLAKFDSLTNRAAYIRTGINWMNVVSSYVVSRAAFIMTRTTVNLVNAVTWDISTNAGANPAITLLAALTIVD